MVDIASFLRGRSGIGDIQGINGPMGGGLPRNILEQIAPAMGSPDPMPAPVPAQAQPARPRRSFLETIGQLSDVIARVGGAEPLYQSMIDAREDRTRQVDLDALRKQQMQMQMQTGAQESERGRLAQALGAIAENPDAVASWPQIAQEAGIDPQRAQALGAILQNNPQSARVFAQSLGWQPEKQGSQAKEMQVYNLLKEAEPELADQYLQSIADPRGLSDYQAKQIEVALARIASGERIAAGRNATQVRVAGMRGIAPGGGKGQPDRAAIARGAQPVVAGLRDAVQRLYQSGGMTSEQSGTLGTLGTMARESIPGVERLASPEGFSAREDFNRLTTVGIPALLPLMGGLTLGGKNIDAAKELDTWRNAIASAKDYPSAMRAIQGFESRIAELTAEQANARSTARPAPRRTVRPAGSGGQSQSSGWGKAKVVQ